jgi:hypothetical protein
MKEKLIFTIICFSFALCSQAQSKQHIKVAFTGLMYATYCDTVNLDFRNSEVKALAVSETEYGLEYTEMQIVPAGTGMLLHSLKPGVYTIPVTSEKPDSVPPTAMIGTLESTPVSWTDSDSCHNYILQTEGFKRATGMKLKANRAYLHTKYDVTKHDSQIDQLFQALLEKEQESAIKLFSRINNPWIYRLLGVLIFFVGYALYLRIKKQYKKQ